MPANERAGTARRGRAGARVTARETEGLFCKNDGWLTGGTGGPRFRSKKVGGVSAKGRPYCSSSRRRWRPIGARRGAGDRTQDLGVRARRRQPLRWPGVVAGERLRGQKSLPRHDGEDATASAPAQRALDESTSVYRGGSARGGCLGGSEAHRGEGDGVRSSREAGDRRRCRRSRG